MNAFIEVASMQRGTFRKWFYSFHDLQEVHLGVQVCTEQTKAHSWIAFHSLQNSTAYSLCALPFRGY